MTRLSHRLEYALLRAVVWLLERVPLETARRAGAALGRLGYQPLGIRRDVVERQLAGAFPGLTPHDVAALSRQSYAHLGRMAIELTLLRSLGRERVGELFEDDNDFGLVEEAVRGGRGAVLFTEPSLSLASVALPVPRPARILAPRSEPCHRVDPVKALPL